MTGYEGGKPPEGRGPGLELLAAEGGMKRSHRDGPSRWPYGAWGPGPGADAIADGPGDTGLGRNNPGHNSSSASPRYGPATRGCGPLASTNAKVTPTDLTCRFP